MAIKLNQIKKLIKSKDWRQKPVAESSHMHIILKIVGERH